MKILIVVGSVRDEAQGTPTGTGCVTFVNSSQDLVVVADPECLIVDTDFDIVNFTRSGRDRCEATSKAFMWAQGIALHTKDQHVMNPPTDPRVRGPSRYRDGRNR